MSWLRRTSNLRLETRRPELIELGINIDHVATLRQARGTSYPEPAHAVLIAEQSGADLITLHLREDRRHIVDDDVSTLRGLIQTRMNLEMAATEEMVVIASRIKPHDVCLVPEKREELTTEGGLDVSGREDSLRSTVQRLQDVGIKVSMFIDPEQQQIEASCEIGADAIEIHTGGFADAVSINSKESELARIEAAIGFASTLPLRINAGHGLHYHNVSAVAALPGIAELNIGHAIIARAVFTGLAEAVSEMKKIVNAASL
ncbi:MAG TPA: pyridoxine 5'-phosphate synthase [Gammaproteobacteria bacterium]|nr:pyridoxine 5'-phosphate synthase [Acidiferrobacteraceae bacterium]HCF74822.1 pyridoxine 5'-phosphate synthase [Gammaproteobacteria bacterium]